MTCMKQEFCLHEKYCQRHIGQNFDSCILFSRNSKPMTNEEWIKSANTEQLAEILVFMAENKNETKTVHKENVGKCVWWLKQPHTPKE